MIFLNNIFNMNNKNMNNMNMNNMNMNNMNMNNMNNMNMNNNRIGIVDDERCEYHVQTPEHQESPNRIIAIRQKLKETGLYDQLIKIEPIDPENEDLLLVHTDKYINKVVRTCSNYPRAMIDSQDVRVSGKDSLISAGVAVGGVLSAVDTVINSDNIRKVFCNIRPPGHHASSHKASGFCIFNNVAIGVKKALTYPGINSVLIFDWDLHHGNGTQTIFKCSKDVMFSSFHRGEGFYPDSGKYAETGKYYNIDNHPQHEHNTIEEYMTEFYNDFLPKAYEFNPDIVFISCGFDGHKDDMYEALPLDYDNFKQMTKELCILANKCSKSRLVSVLEGGYTLNVLAKCTTVHIQEMLNNN
jgi:acetoin utilization deacetylase AcuC-like enzyme